MRAAQAYEETGTYEELSMAIAVEPFRMRCLIDPNRRTYQWQPRRKP